MKRYYRSAATRFLVLPVSGAATLLTARVITSHYGVESYAIYSIVAALPLLLPFADLGIGAAVTNATSAARSRPNEFHAVLRQSFRTLFVVGGFIVLVSLALSATGTWASLLNLPSSTGLNWAVGLAVACFAAAVPGSLGARVLIGTGRNATAIGIQTLPSIVMLITANGMALADASPNMLIASSLAGAAIANWIGVAVALPMMRDRTQRDRSARMHTQLIATAIPAVLVSIALPLTFQSGRIVLAWSAPLADVAAYAAGMTLYLPALSVVQAASVSLWADFARARSNGAPAGALYGRSLAVSCGIGAAAGLGVALAGPWVVRYIISPDISIPPLLFPLLGLLLFVQSAQLPAGMYLTSPRGLWFQAWTAIAMAAVFLPSAWYLADMYGSSGVVAATASAVALVQFVPCMLRVIVDVRATRVEYAAESEKNGGET